jgi:hypothetical protein
LDNLQKLSPEAAALDLVSVTAFAFQPLDDFINTQAFARPG